MSREQDLLFCKIAITNGLVSEQQAKKAIAMANQKEQESGRRPMIGAIFSKYNLISQQEVQTLYQAVNKRLGTTGVPGSDFSRGGASTRGTARSRGGARTNARQSVGGKPSVAGNRKTVRKVDPATLWTGIIFGLVFIGILVGMIIFWVTYDKDDGQDSARQDKSTQEQSRSTGSSGTSVADGEREDLSTGASAAKPQMNPDQKRKINQQLNDARMSHTELRHQDALDQVKRLKKAIEDNNVPVDDLLKKQIDSDLAKYEAAVQAEAGDEPAAGDGAEDEDLGDDLE